MLRRAPLLTAVLALACGAPAAPLPARPAPRVDPAIELADRLPSGFDRCVVVRPRRLSAQQRALVTRFSWADPRAFQDGLSIVAFATASVRLPGGQLARHTIYRFSPGETPPRERMGLGIDQGAACPGPGCGSRTGQWLDDHTLEVTRYRWPERGSQPPGRGFWSPSCVAMARSHPNAFEVAVSRSLRRSRLPTPQWTLRSMRGQGGLRMRVERVFSSEDDARRFEQALGLGYDAAETLSSLPPTDQHIERTVHRVRVTDRHSWDALELAVEDERLRREARRRGRQRQTPTPVDQVDVTRLDRVRREIVLHRSLLERSGASTREQNARAYATLLDRALRVHPSTPELVRERVTLALHDLDEPADALPLLDRMLTADAPEPEGWRLLRREVLARLADDSFVVSLLENGIASNETSAARAAQAIRALQSAGMVYESAERAWVLRREMFERPPGLIDVPDAPRIPWSSALSTVTVLLRRQQGPAPQVLFGVLAPDRDVGFGRVGDPPQAARLQTVGTSYIVGATAGGLAGLQRLSMAVAEPIAGRVTLHVELRDAAGSVQAEATLEGLVTPGRMFEIRRSSVALRNQPWPHIQRYVAQPLANLPTTLFPPPVVQIQADSPELAERLRRVRPEQCTISGHTVRCTAENAADFDTLMPALVEAGLEGAETRAPSRGAPSPRPSQTHPHNPF